MRPTIAGCLVALFAALAATAVSAKPTGRLNDTGTTGCGPSDCAGSGQDGEFGRDVTDRHPADGRAGFSFVKVCNTGELAGKGSCPADPVLGPAPGQWGCTKDRVTGLIWEIKTRDGGLRDWRRGYTNYTPNDPRIGAADLSVFVKAVNEVGLCGQKDWRLPQPIELQGIVDYSRASAPAIVKNWFPNTRVSGYWTPVNMASDGGASAWMVSFNDGQVFYASRSGGGMARLVRPGAAQAEPGRFVVDGGEATDTLTGLVWRRCGEGLRWSGTACAPFVGSRRFNWRDALAHAGSVAASTGVAWRLPNAKELMSIVDHSGSYPRAIDASVFAGAEGSFWSSTPGRLDPWAVSWNFGSLKYQYNLDENGIFLVRDAP